MMNCRILTASAAALAIACTSTQGEAIVLELDPPVGFVLPLEAVVQQTISQEIEGVEQTIDQEIAYGYTQVVESRGDDGSILLSMTYDSFRAVTEGSMGRLVLDSSEPGVDPMSRAFAGVIGNSVRIRVASSGDVEEIEGMGAFLDAMFAGLEPDQAAALRGAIEAQFGEESIKRLVEPFLSIYPEGPVRVGDRWEQEITVDAFFPHEQRNTYELLSRRDGIATIGMTSVISPAEASEPVTLGAARFQVSMSGEQEGSLRIDEASGMAVGMELEQELSGAMRRADGEDGDAWPMRVSTRLTVRERDRAH